MLNKRPFFDFFWKIDVHGNFKSGPEAEGERSETEHSAKDTENTDQDSDETEERK